MKNRLLYILLLASSGLFFACSNYDSFSDNPSFRLSFSEDTIRFDTLVSTVSSPTKTLYVFNNNSDGLRVSNIRLQKGEESLFRVNVDGEYLAYSFGNDYLIRKNDSIIVRIEVTMPENGTTDTVTYSDELLFSLENGAQQRVLLTAGAFDAYIIHGMFIKSDSTLATDKPYLIYDSLVIAKGATLDLLPGTKLLMHDSTAVDIYGRINAQGTIEKPIVFRGARTDRMFDYLFYDNTPSRWKGVTIHTGSYGNTFVNTDFHSGRWGIYVDSTSLDHLSLFMQNCIIHNIGGDGLNLNNCSAEVLNTQISNTLGDCVSIYGGVYTFRHCTIAQYYPLSYERGDAFYVSNVYYNGAHHELRNVQVLNSVIMGYAEDVIMGNLYDEYEDYQNYLFQNCFLRTVGNNDDKNFISCKFENKDMELQGEKNFKVFDTHNFIYDFTPDSLSEIRNMADPLLMNGLVSDRLGRSRTSDEAPDAGCYEYIMPKKE
ncbi:MAG: right-handed parallel beta-helix repeat-containing protein [Bacteroidaceae bacterium]|nr:right-handed parallel beta-helix repeat-containing protein [Bacteroidaceae bacterium]